MIKIGGLREDRQMRVALKQQINQWLLAINQKDKQSQPSIPKNKRSPKSH